MHVDDVTGETLTMVVIRTGQSALIKFLIQHSADGSANDKQGRSP